MYDGVTDNVSIFLMDLRNLNSRKKSLDNYRLVLGVKNKQIFNNQVYLALQSKICNIYYKKEHKSRNGEISTEHVVENIASFKSHQFIELNSTVTNYEIHIDAFATNQYYTDKNFLYVLGVDLLEDQDRVMYILNGKKGDDKLLPSVWDVNSVYNIIDAQNKVLLNINDVDRLSKRNRNSTIILENSNVVNIALGHKKTHWDEVNFNFVIGLREEINNVPNLFTYDTKLNLIDNNFHINFWKKTKDMVFYLRIEERYLYILFKSL